MVALSVAAVLAIFLLYTSIAGGGTPVLRPSKLAGHTGKVTLEGTVAGKPAGDAHAAAGLRFTLRDVKGTATVPVVYHGTVPDLFKTGRAVVVDEGHQSYGASAELAAVIADGAFWELDAPVKRAGAMDVPIPFSPVLEDETVPTGESVAELAKSLVGKR